MRPGLNRLDLEEVPDIFVHDLALLLELVFAVRASELGAGVSRLVPVHTLLYFCARGNARFYERANEQASCSLPVSSVCVFVRSLSSL